MIGVHISPLVRRQQRHVDQLAIQRRQGQLLKAVHRPLAAGDRLRRRHDLQGLDADAPLAFAIVTRLVGQDHAGKQRLGVDVGRDALRPLVHAQIGADAMAGAVVEVETGVPQRLTRDGVQLVPRRPGGEADYRHGDVALQDQSEHAALVRRALADCHGAGHVRGPVQILTAAIHQQQRARLHRPDLGPDRLVVRQGAVRPDPGDGVEGQVLQHPGGLTEALQRLDHRPLVRQLFLGHRIDPMQEAGQGRAVADVGLTAALDLDGVLLGARQGAGVHAAHDGGARRFQPVEIPGRGHRRVDQHLLPRQGVQRGGQRLGRLQRHGVAQPARQFVGDLGGVEEDLGCAVRLHHRLSQRQGRADHVAAANVEQPGQRRRRGQHRHLRALGGDGLTDAGALQHRVLAGISVVVRHDRRLRLGRAGVAPGQVNGIGLDRLQRRPGLLDRRAQRRQRIRAVQTRIIADHRTGAHALQPGGQPVQLDPLEQGRIRLGFGLNRIAAVDEDRRPVHQHHARPGRAGEAADPGQTLAGVGQVFVLMLVLVRDQQAVQALLRHLGAQQRQVLGPEGGIGGFVECLAHEGSLHPSPLAGEGGSRSETDEGFLGICPAPSSTVARPLIRP
ncbi:hypothetical protein D3C87_1201780 [compost metagenome]